MKLKWAVMILIYLLCVSFAGFVSAEQPENNDLKYALGFKQVFASYLTEMAGIENQGNQISTTDTEAYRLLFTKYLDVNEKIFQQFKDLKATKSFKACQMNVLSGFNRDIKTQKSLLKKISGVKEASKLNQIINSGFSSSYNIYDGARCFDSVISGWDQKTKEEIYSSKEYKELLNGNVFQK